MPGLDGGAQKSAKRTRKNIEILLKLLSFRLFSVLLSAHFISFLFSEFTCEVQLRMVTDGHPVAEVRISEHLLRLAASTLNLYIDYR